MAKPPFLGKAALPTEAARSAHSACAHRLQRWLGLTKWLGCST